MPKVSVVIPTFNRSTYVCQAIDSVLAQSLQDLEIIVVDDGSTDDTVDRLAAYENRVRTIQQRNAGPAMARNRGVISAAGEYVAFLDSDDLFYPDKLEKQVNFMEEHPELGFSCTDYSQGPALQDQRRGVMELRGIEPGDLFSHLCRRNVVCTVTVLARREELGSAGLFDPTLRASEDFDLWMRLAYFRRGAYLPDILTHVRDHPERTMRSIEFYRERRRAVRILAGRWSGGTTTPEQWRDLRGELSARLVQLAWRERQEGNPRAAGSAFIDAARLETGPGRWGTAVRGVALWACPWATRALDALRGKS